jgi:universal stress protein E
MKMSKIEKILFCIHPDVPNHELIERTTEIARTSNATVTVYHTIGDYPEDTSEWWNVRNPEELKRKIVDERQGQLDDVADQFRKLGFEKVSTLLDWGRPFLQITREVMKNQYDLVMITSRRSGNLSRILLDCPSMDLLQHCPCRLWISKRKKTRNTKRILASVGGSENAECQAMDMKVVSTAAAIAEAEGAELHIAHALPLYGSKADKQGKLDPELVKFIEDAKKKFLKQCQPVVREYDVALGIENLHFQAGQPSHVIIDVVKNNEMGLVVIGTKPPKGLPVFQIGNQAVTVLDNIDCDMVGVKPDDFVSLIEKEGEHV